MVFNMTELLSLLPADWDNKTAADHISILNATVPGFSNLTTPIQEWVASLMLEDLAGLGNISSHESADAKDFLLWVHLSYKATTTPLSATLNPITYCEVMDIYLDQDWVRIGFLIAVACLLILMWFRQRRRLGRKCCDGRPGVVVPINFIDCPKNRWMYACVFVIISYRALSLFDGQNIIDVPADLKEDPNWKSKFSWVGNLVKLLNVLLVAVTFYPLLACVTMRKHIPANFLGALNVLYWLTRSLLTSIICLASVNFTGTFAERQILIMHLLFEMPVLASYILLLIVFVVDLFLNIKKLCKRKDDSSYRVDTRKATLQYKFRNEVAYVKALITRQETRSPVTLKEKIRFYTTYTRLPGFAYSPRVICTMVVAFCCLYKMCTWIAVVIEIQFSKIQEGVAYLHPIVAKNLGATNKSTYWFDHSAEILQIFRITLVVCNYVSALVQVLMMVHMILCYRQHVRLLLKGDNSWHYERNASPMADLSCTFRYSGYQIAYILYGYIMLLLLLVFVVLAFTLGIVLPLRDGYSNFIIEKIKQLWPSIIVGLLIYWTQNLIARFFFCQDRGKYLALNNRSVYHVFTYLLFFFNVILGLFSCLKRLVLSLVFGTLTLSRLDANLLFRGFERFDSGFSAYLGTLRTEVYHTHPVMKAFVAILWDTFFSEKQKRPSSNENAEENEMINKRPVNKRVRNKWWKALTLSKNKGLVYERLQRAAYARAKTMKEGGLATIMMDGAGATGAFFLVAGASAAADSASGITSAVDV